MAKDNRTAYHQQLPKFRRLSLLDYLAILGTIASIVGLVAGFGYADRMTYDAKVIVALSYLFVIILLLGVSIWVINRKKLHRYAQSVFFVHYVNHIIRDYLAESKDGDFKGTVGACLDSISTCFSILTGKRCRVCVKEMGRDEHITTYHRDTLSNIKGKDAAGVVHGLRDNTDFYNVWYGDEGCPRYYFSNNLKSDWKAHKYKNSSFKEQGEPQSIHLFGFTLIYRWPLDYRSTIVLPIRYIPDSSRWPPRKEGQPQLPPDPTKDPRTWGFLCIDCNSTGVFGLPHSPELGAAFADALYTLFSSQKAIIERKISAN